MESLSSKINAANHTLISKGQHDAISEFFTSDYIAHVTGQDLAGGHKLISQFRDGLIAEEWVISDLAEQLLLARKKV